MTSVKSQAVDTADSNYNILTADMNVDPPRLEEIHWEDHFVVHNWQSFKDVVSRVQDEFIARTVGWRIFEDKDIVVLSQTVIPSQGTQAEAMVILKATIVSRHKLTKKRK